MIIPSLSSSFSMRAWHQNDKTDSWSHPRLLTHTHRLIHTDFLLPPNASFNSQKTHGALHTQKEQACQRRHSLVWLREGQMALNHTSSSGHIIKRHQFVCGRDPDRQTTHFSNTPLLRVNGVHSCHRLVQPKPKHGTYKQNTAPGWPLLCPLLVSSHLRLH